MNREWSRRELEDDKTVAWLKRMNAKGNDIYVRPAGEHGLVLVDDLKPEALKAMREQGYTPAATIETSPNNYQAWIKLADSPLPAEVRRMAAQSLAQHFGGDPNSADSRHYGRLAGFTNQKPQHTRNGRQPYVLSHDHSGEVASSAKTLLERIEARLDVVEAQKERETRLAALNSTPDNHNRYDPLREYRQQAKRLMAKYGEDTDLSRMDWMIATDMAKSNRFTQQDIERGIRECSPNVESRKVGHLEDYAQRTAEKAWNAPELLAQRQAREAQKGLDNDAPSHGR